MKAVVIGGGLAGITAALALAQAQHEVTLLEAKPRLGGATMSFNRDGLVIDTGQHVFLRCCTAYRGLLDRLGMSAHAPIQPRFDITVVSPRKTAKLKRRRVPAPLHMLPALLGYPFLNWTERSRLSLAALAFRRLDENDPKTDELSLGDWLAAHGQDERTRRVLWDLFSVSSLNVPGDDASLALAAVVVKTGLLGDADAADIGVPSLPLGELHGAAAVRVLGKLGATVRLQAKVAAIEAKDPRQFVVRLDGEEEALDADAVVLAVPHEQAAKLLPVGALPDGTTAAWDGLGAAPIVNVHVIYDRKVMDVPLAAGVDSPVQWVFDRTRISGMHARGDEGQYLAISLSAADEYADKPVAELREQFLPALAELFPKAEDAAVTEFFVTREKRATFRQVPGTAKLRPAAGTQLPGLVLAGSWTDTGWPDTMEGAVRSGLSAVLALSSPGGATPRTPRVRPAARPMAKGAIVSNAQPAAGMVGHAGESGAGVADDPPNPPMSEAGKISDVADSPAPGTNGYISGLAASISEDRVSEDRVSEDRVSEDRVSKDSAVTEVVEPEVNTEAPEVNTKADEREVRS